MRLFQRRAPRMHLLTDADHTLSREQVSESLVLPGIDLSQLAAHLDHPTTSAAIRAYRELIRNP